MLSITAFKCRPKTSHSPSLFNNLRSCILIELDQMWECMNESLFQNNGFSILSTWHNFNAAFLFFLSILQVFERLGSLLTLFLSKHKITPNSNFPLLVSSSSLYSILPNCIGLLYYYRLESSFLLPYLFLFTYVLFIGGLPSYFCWFYDLVTFHLSSKCDFKTPKLGNE